MRSMSVSDLAYHHHRDLNEVFSRYKHLMEDSILVGTYQLDYSEDMTGAVITLGAPCRDEDPQHEKKVKTLLARLEKEIRRYFKQQNMRCEIKLIFNQEETIEFSVESARFVKAKLSALKGYKGKFGEPPIDPRVLLNQGLDRFAQLQHSPSLEALSRDLNLYVFGCLLPAIISLTNTYPQLACCSGLIDNLIDVRNLIGLQGVRHMQSLKTFQARLQKKVAGALLELVQDELLEMPKLRAEVKAEFIKLPYSYEALERVSQWIISIKELLPLIASLKEQAEEVFELTMVYEIAVFNAAVIFDPDLERYWLRALGTTYQHEYQAFIAKGYAKMGCLKASYQRYKTYYSVLHAQLEKFCKELEHFQQKALRHRSAFSSSMRQISRLQQQTVSSLSFASEPAEVSSVVSLGFFGPSNLNATKESKQHAASLAAQLERKRQPTLLEVLPAGISANAEAPATWVKLAVHGTGSVDFDLATGRNAQGDVVAVRVAPALQFPVYVVLLGTLELSEQETQNLLQQEGREFLTKTGRGANGLKRFGDNMLGLKSLVKSERLVLVGMPLPMGQGWCYVPARRMDHAQWEALQSDHPTNRQRWQQLRDTVTTQTALTCLEDVASPQTGLAL